MRTPSHAGPSSGVTDGNPTIASAIWRCSSPHRQSVALAWVVAWPLFRFYVSHFSPPRNCQLILLFSCLFAWLFGCLFACLCVLFGCDLVSCFLFVGAALRPSTSRVPAAEWEAFAKAETQTGTLGQVVFRDRCCYEGQSIVHGHQTCGRFEDSPRVPRSRAFLD